MKSEETPELRSIKDSIRSLTDIELRELISYIHEFKNREAIEEFVKEIPSVKDAFFMYKYDSEFDKEYVLNFAYMKNGVHQPDDYRWSEDEKEYIYMVTSLLGLSESCENSYFLYEPDIAKTIAELKRFGFKQVDPWW